MGPKPTQPNVENCSLAELDLAVACGPSKRAHFRMLAIKSLLLGINHDTTAELFNVSRRTLFIWIARFNARGIDGLLGRPAAVAGCFGRGVAPADVARQILEGVQPLMPVSPGRGPVTDLPQRGRRNRRQ